MAKRPDWRLFQKRRFRSHSVRAKAKNVNDATMRHAKKFVLGRWRNVREVRQSVALWLLGVGVLIALGTVQFMWFEKSYKTISPVSGGTYAEGVTGKITTLNPLYARSQPELSLQKLLFSSLYTYDSSGNLTEDLASSRAVSDDGKTYTLKLRDDARWHDGKPVTAKDIAFTISLIKKPAVGSPLNVSWQDVEVAVVDDHTVTFTLPSAYAAFAYALTFPVLPNHILKDLNPSQLRESRYSTEPIGSGPFSVRHIQGGSDEREVVHLKANDNYYNGRPRLDRFQLHAFTSPEAMQTALRQKQINAAIGLTNIDPAAFAQAEYSTKMLSVNAGVYALFNTTQPPFDDVSVRKALQLATNTDRIRESLYTRPKPLYTPFVNSQIDTSAVPRPQFNTDKAQKMLDKAGWKKNASGLREKDKQPLRIDIVTLKDPEYDSVMQKIAGQWRDIGIEVNTRSVDPYDVTQNMVSSVLQPRNFSVAIYELSIGADPDVFAFWHSSQATARGLNFTGYSSEIGDDILTSARATNNSRLREIKYQNYAKQWLEDAPAIGLYQSSVPYVSMAVARNVASDARLVAVQDRYVNVRYWTVRQESVYKTP